MRNGILGQTKRRLHNESHYFFVVIRRLAETAFTCGEIKWN